VGRSASKTVGHWTLATLTLASSFRDAFRVWPLQGDR
jgi:hypothetical protein